MKFTIKEVTFLQSPTLPRETRGFHFFLLLSYCHHSLQKGNCYILVRNGRRYIWGGCTYCKSCYSYGEMEGCENGQLLFARSTLNESMVYKVKTKHRVNCKNILDRIKKKEFNGKKNYLQIGLKICKKIIIFGIVSFVLEYHKIYVKIFLKYTSWKIS